MKLMAFGKVPKPASDVITVITRVPGGDAIEHDCARNARLRL
jgi:hypothetical protein